MDRVRGIYIRAQLDTTGQWHVTLQDDAELGATFVADPHLLSAISLALRINRVPESPFTKLSLALDSALAVRRRK